MGYARAAQGAKVVAWDQSSARCHASSCIDPLSAAADTTSDVLCVDVDDACRYEVQRHALFFTDAGAKKIYKDHVAFLLNRNNSING